MRYNRRIYVKEENDAEYNNDETNAYSVPISTEESMK